LIPARAKASSRNAGIVGEKPRTRKKYRPFLPMENGRRGNGVNAGRHSFPGAIGNTFVKNAAIRPKENAKGNGQGKTRGKCP